ncbi:MAG: hypothetical protein JZU60_00270 [Ilumatobacteraceae bacterium]|nr:hypothetical protein [Ilumatobacteraceae bacterium]
MSAANTLGWAPQHPAPTRQRPTDIALVKAIARSFAVNEWEAHGWLSAMDFDAASDDLIHIDRERLPVKAMPWGHLVASSRVAA